VKPIFVGNLDFDADEDAIRSLFEQYGSVNKISIVTDRDTGRSRGFAFVEMSDHGQADQAIRALNGYAIDGRALNVNEARPKVDEAQPKPKSDAQHRRRKREPWPAVDSVDADAAEPPPTMDSLSLTLDDNLSSEQITAALTALADYFRVCGGVGFKIVLEREIYRSETDRG
jgi:RNA recognition motif-containing protein